VNTTERAQIDRQLAALDKSIRQEEDAQARDQSGWCEDRYRTIQRAQKIGAMKRERTTLSQRRAALTSVDETSVRSSAIFSGSNF
jgi:hypothetical protein